MRIIDDYVSQERGALVEVSRDGDHCSGGGLQRGMDSLKMS